MATPKPLLQKVVPESGVRVGFHALSSLILGFSKSLQLWSFRQLEGVPWYRHKEVRNFWKEGKLAGSTLYRIFLAGDGMGTLTHKCTISPSIRSHFSPLLSRHWVTRVLLPSSHPPYGSGLTWDIPPCVAEQKTPLLAI